MLFAKKKVAHFICLVDSARHQNRFRRSRHTEMPFFFKFADEHDSDLKAKETLPSFLVLLLSFFFFFLGFELDGCFPTRNMKISEN